MAQLTQLTIYITKGDRWKHQQLYHVFLDVARRHQMAGITVTRAVAGIGASGRIRTLNILALSVDLSLVVTLIDQPRKIQIFLETAQPMMHSGLVTLQPIEVLDPVLTR